MKRRHYYIAIVGLLICSLVVYVSSTHADDKFPGASIDSGDAVVYVVFAIDTEPARFSPWKRPPKFDFSPFADTGRKAQIAAVMDATWRNQYRDSRNRPPQFTWFVMSHEAFRHTDDCGCAAVYDSLMKFKSNIERFGDEIGWHYHHADWTDPNRDGVSSWNQLTTFDGAVYAHGTDIEIAERALGCLIDEKGIFPTAFRSGWVWENNRFSKWLERLFPYDFSANPGNAEPERRIEPLRNVYDWGRAPASYAGYHPHAFDYQRPGCMRRWIFRTLSPGTPREWNRLFLAAKDGPPPVFCFTAHSFDNLQKDIDGFLGVFLKAADSAGIDVHFATASTAGAARAGASGYPAPSIKLTLHDSVLIITTDRAIFQPYPFCAACSNRDEYHRIIPILDSASHWHIDVSLYANRKIICAVSSLSGKSASASIIIP